MPNRFLKCIERAIKSILQLPLNILLARGRPERLPLNPAEVKSILILRPDKIGDMVVTVPLIHAVKERFPHVTLHVMASPRNVEIIRDDPHVDAIHLYIKNIWKDGQTIYRLRRKNFDIIYDPICHDSITGLLLSRIIKNNSALVASRKLNLIKFYDYAEKYEPDGRDHNIDNGLILFKAFGISPESVDPFRPVFLPLESKEKAAKFRRELPSSGKILIGINISAGSATRTLSPQKYIAILKMIRSRLPEAQFIIISIPVDRHTARKILTESNIDALLIPDNLSLLDVGAIISHLDILITPDTSLVHIARLMKIPVVAIYSGHRRNYFFWRPYRQEGGAVVAANVSNLHDVEAEQVVEAFFRLIERSEIPTKGNIKAD